MRSNQVQVQPKEVDPNQLEEQLHILVLLDSRVGPGGGASGVFGLWHAGNAAAQVYDMNVYDMQVMQVYDMQVHAWRIFKNTQSHQRL